MDALRREPARDDAYPCFADVAFLENLLIVLPHPGFHVFTHPAWEALSQQAYQESLFFPPIIEMIQ